MKIISSILILLAFCTFSATAIFAQSNASKTYNQPQTTAEPLGENESIPFMREQEQEIQASGVSTGGLLVKTFGAMLLIVGLIFFGAWGLKKAGFNPLKKNAETDAPDLAVLSSVSLGTNRTLSVVKFGERVLLVGSTAQSFTLLADKSEIEAEDSASVINNPRSVGEMLAEEALANKTQEDFRKDFIEAQKRMNFYEKTGGEI